MFHVNYRLFLSWREQLDKPTFYEPAAQGTWGWFPTHLCLMTWTKSLLFNCKYRSVIASERHSTTSRQRVFITPWNFGSRKNTVFMNLTSGHGQWVAGQPQPSPPEDIHHFSILPIGQWREVFHSFVQAHDKFVFHCILVLFQLFYNQFTHWLLQYLKNQVSFPIHTSGNLCDISENRFILNRWESALSSRVHQVKPGALVGLHWPLSTSRGSGAVSLGEPGCVPALVLQALAGSAHVICQINKKD